MGDEMVGWHHDLNGHEFEQTLGDSEGQGSLACTWGCKELDLIEGLNNNKSLQQFKKKKKDTEIHTHKKKEIHKNRIPMLISWL